MNHRRARRALIGAMIASTLILSACSDADGGSSSKSEAKADDVTAAAEERLSGVTSRPTDIGITEELPEAAPENKTVYWIQCGAIACVSLGDALDEATDALGWDLVRVEAGLSPETIKNAWGEAARAVPAPDAVLSSGFPREIFEEEIQSLAERDIPIVNLSVDDEAGDGLTAIVGSAEERNVAVGEIQAAWVLSRSGEDTNALFVQVPAFPTHVVQGEAFKKTFDELCSSCELEILDMPAESMGTDLPQRLVAHLQANPDIDQVVLAFGDMAVGVPTAIRDAGLADRINIVTDTPDPTVATYIDENDVVTAATGYPGPEMAWKGIDIAIRQMLGADISESVDAPLPAWVLTSDNIPDTAKAFPLVEDYADQFKSLWGLD